MNILRRILTLVSGTAAAQLILLISLPVLTRVYSPESFGYLAEVTALSILLSIVFTLRLEVAIVRPLRDLVARKMVSVILIQSLTFFLILELFFVIFFEFGSVGQVATVVALSVSINSIISNFYLRKGMYGRIAFIRFYQATLTVVIQIILSYYDIKQGLLIGYLVGGALPLIFESRVLVFNPKIRQKDISYLYRRYIAFPLYNASQAILNAFGNNSLIFLVGLIFGSNMLGQYAVATRAIQTPLSILSQAIRQVTYKIFSDMKNKKESIYQTLKQQTLIAGLIALIPAMLFYQFSIDIVVFVFGEEWKVAGDISKYLVLWFYFVFLGAPTVSIIQVLNYQKGFLIYEIVLIVTRFIFLLIGYFLSLKFSNFILGYALIGGMFNLGLVLIVIFKVKEKENRNENRNVNLP